MAFTTNLDKGAARTSDAQEWKATLEALLDLFKKHVYGTHEHLEVIKSITSKLQSLQREGLVTTYELGDCTQGAVHVHIFMPLEDFVIEKRKRIRRELRTLGRPYDLHVDSHIEPDTDCGEAK